jgi:hypothetical protein
MSTRPYERPATPQERQYIAEQIIRTLPPEMRQRFAPGTGSAPAARTDAAPPSAAVEQRREIDALRPRVDAWIAQQAQQPFSSPEEFSAARARADTIAGIFGQQTTAPGAHESLIQYRQRLLRPLLKYSPRTADVNVETINDAAMLDLVERAVRQDAVITADEIGKREGRLMPIRERDAAGRLITKWVGSLDSWFNAFTRAGAPVRINP